MDDRVDEEVVLVYDPELKRPACALLQAAFASEHYSLVHLWDTSLWLTTPTKGMRRVKGTRAEWVALAELDNAQAAKK